ncbi:MAG: DUF1501 domain-containing protein [Verrucomicrobiales bacterium]|nr:DUF1501 domain-containing protein [Verrucomicrobiales bacterium]
MNYLKRLSDMKANRPTRRRFLAQSGCGAMGALSMVNTLAHLKLMQGALAQSAGSGYKALVCVFLNGGNDSNNLFIPATGTARADYDTARPFDLATSRGIGVPVDHLNRVQPLNAASLYEMNAGYNAGTDPFGFHTRAPHFKTLFDAEDLAVLCNVGTLTEAGMTRATYGTADRPPQLFSHADQQKQWQSSVPDRPFTSGWGGRVADLLDPIHNTAGSSVSMNISIAGVNSLMVSATGQVSPYIMNQNGVVGLSGYGTRYANALLNTEGAVFDPANYTTSDHGKRLKAFEKIVQMTHDNLLEGGYNGVVYNARFMEGLVGGALGDTDNGTGGTTLDQHFIDAYAGAGQPGGQDAAGSFALQMKMVARLIAGRTHLGNNRQIFFVQLTGWDTHLAQNNNSTLFSGTAAGHNALIGNLSCAMKGFSDAMKALGVWDDVTCFTASDFARTFNPNKPVTDLTAGTDHAWGGHAVVMGGKVKGGRVYGKFPNLVLGSATGSLDATGSRGRWIPTTSVDQYAAVLARWMGVDSELHTVFPNLHRFDDPFSVASANLDFMDLT